MFQVNALLLTEDEEWQERFSEYAERNGLHLTVAKEMKKMLGQQHYHIYFFDLDTVPLQQIIPQMTAMSAVIGLTRKENFEVSREWLIRGAKDIIVFPEEKLRFEALIQEIITQYTIQREADMGFGTGEVHTFYSAKGGSGCTILAAMMSQSLSVHYQKKVLLIDLNAQYGVTDALFSMQPQRSYYDLLPVVNEIEMRHIQNVANEHVDTGVFVISSPSDPEKTEQITDELIAKLIRVARAHFDHVILDLPSAMNSITFTALNAATKLHYVMTPDSLGLRSYKYANELFKKFSIGTGITKTLLLNKVHAKSEMTSSDIGKIIGTKVDAQFSDDFYGMQSNINMGTGFYRNKNHKGDSKVAKDMKKYIDSFVLKSKE